MLRRASFDAWITKMEKKVGQGEIVGRAWSIRGGEGR